MKLPIFLEKIKSLGFNAMGVTFNPTYSRKVGDITTFLYVDEKEKLPVTRWGILTKGSKELSTTNIEKSTKMSFEDCLKSLK